MNAYSPLLSAKNVARFLAEKESKDRPLENSFQYIAHKQDVLYEDYLSRACQTLIAIVEPLIQGKKERALIPSTGFSKLGYTKTKFVRSIVLGKEEFPSCDAEDETKPFSLKKPETIEEKETFLIGAIAYLRNVKKIGMASLSYIALWLFATPFVHKLQRSSRESGGGPIITIREVLEEDRQGKWEQDEQKNFFQSFETIHGDILDIEISSWTRKEHEDFFFSKPETQSRVDFLIDIADQHWYQKKCSRSPRHGESLFVLREIRSLSDVKKSLSPFEDGWIFVVPSQMFFETVDALQNKQGLHVKSNSLYASFSTPFMNHDEECIHVIPDSEYLSVRELDKAAAVLCLGHTNHLTDSCIWIENDESNLSYDFRPVHAQRPSEWLLRADMLPKHIFGSVSLYSWEEFRETMRRRKKRNQDGDSKKEYTISRFSYSLSAPFLVSILFPKDHFVSLTKAFLSCIFLSSPIYLQTYFKRKPLLSVVPCILPTEKGFSMTFYSSHESPERVLTEEYAELFDEVSRIDLEYSIQHEPRLRVIEELVRRWKYPNGTFREGVIGLWVGHSSQQPHIMIVVKDWLVADAIEPDVVSCVQELGLENLTLFEDIHICHSLVQYDKDEIENVEGELWKNHIPFKHRVIPTRWNPLFDRIQRYCPSIMMVGIRPDYEIVLYQYCMGSIPLGCVPPKDILPHGGEIGRKMKIREMGGIPVMDNDDTNSSIDLDAIETVPSSDADVEAKGETLAELKTRVESSEFPPPPGIVYRVVEDAKDISSCGVVAYKCTEENKHLYRFLSTGHSSLPYDKPESLFLYQHDSSGNMNSKDELSKIYRVHENVVGYHGDIPFYADVASLSPKNIRPEFQEIVDTHPTLNPISYEEYRKFHGKSRPIFTTTYSRTGSSTKEPVSTYQAAYVPYTENTVNITYYEKGDLPFLWSGKFNEEKESKRNVILLTNVIEDGTKSFRGCCGSPYIYTKEQNGRKRSHLIGLHTGRIAKFNIVTCCPIWSIEKACGLDDSWKFRSLGKKLDSYKPGNQQ